MFVINVCLIFTQLVVLKSVFAVKENESNSTFCKPTRTIVSKDIEETLLVRNIIPCSSISNHFRCSNYSNQTRSVKKFITLYECCPGYELVLESYVPECVSLKCKNRAKSVSKCNNATGEYICSIGWTGENCTEPCPKGYFGEGCRQACLELANAYDSCDSVTGNKTCKPGYFGAKCEENCTEGYWGKNCKHRCNCTIGQLCSPKTGNCDCPYGFKGYHCNVTCGKERYGKNCEEKCNCQNKSHCDQRNGSCICASGWTGMYCNQTCPKGFYGDNCRHQCADITEQSQLLHTVCNHTTGKYVCKPGYSGELCEICEKQTDCQCPLGYWGSNCKRICIQGYYGRNCAEKCPHPTNSSAIVTNTTCNHVSGNYQCIPGYMGPLCNKPCAKGRYRRKCENLCLCSNEKRCSHVDGKCYCSPGWTGEYCDQPCPSGFYGFNCSRHCERIQVKSHTTQTTCDHVTGVYACEPGYKGPVCDQPCILGTYGVDCNYTCHCRNGAECSPVNGFCICSAGWGGLNCDDRCSPKHYGSGCLYTCPTLDETTSHVRANTIGCDSITGKYNCEPGYVGLLCNETCPQGQFGDNCGQRCLCENDENCNYTTGDCNNLPEWTGDRYQESDIIHVSSVSVHQTHDKRQKVNRSKELTNLSLNEILIYVGIIAFVIINLIVAYYVWRKYLRKKRKRELNKIDNVEIIKETKKCTQDHIYEDLDAYEIPDSYDHLQFVKAPNPLIFNYSKLENCRHFLVKN